MVRARQDDISVLHVDDDPDIAALVTEYLEREDEGLSVQTATSTREGLDRLAETEIDCIVSDYDMPDQDGIEFLEAVRDDRPELPFILYTGKGSETVASEAIRAGVTDYLQKESGTDQYTLLANRIVNAVQRQRASRQLAQMEDRYRSLFTEMNEGAALHELVYDDDGTPIGYEILDVNQNYESILDMPRESVVGKRAVEVYETDHPPYLDRYASVARTGEPTEFETYHAPLDRHFHISVFSPTQDQFATVFSDITESKQQEARLEFFETLQQELTELAIAFLQTDDSDIDSRIDTALETIGSLAEADRSYVFQIDGEAGTMSNTHEWCASGVEPQIDDLQDIPTDTFSWWMQRLENVENVTIPDVSELPPEAHAEQEILQEQNIQSLVVVPMVLDGDLIGFIGFDWVKQGRTLSEEFVDILHLVGQLISNALRRERREREIRRLKERFELAVEGANLGVWDWDLTTDEVEFNERWAEMLGYSLDGIEPHLDAWEKRVHPDDLDAVEATLETHLEDETPYYESEHRMRTADGDWKWIRDMGRVTERDGDGKPIRAVGIHLDIDERKRREQRLEQFREAVEQTAHAVYITDTDGTIEYVNTAFEEITGYSEDEALGRTPSMLSSGEYDQGYYEEFWEAIRSGERWQNEMIDSGADDERIVLNQSVSPITDEDGEPQKFVAVAQDITQRKAYEQELERTREELRQIIDLVPDLIFVKNRAGEYLLTNEATAETYGLSPDEVEGKNESDVIPDVDESEQFREDDLAVIESGESKFIPEEEITTADGETRLLQTTKIPYDVPGRDEDAVLGYARDVTELKEYERRLQEQRDNLEVLNQIVRHDIRNDLQVLSAYVEQCEAYVTEGGQEYVTKVLEAARDAVEITETARDVTELMLQSDVDSVPIRLRHVLNEEIDDVRSRHEHAVVTVEGSIPDVEVIADDMLESMFRNLLQNAIQHNDRDVPEVTVSATVEDDDVIVRIADNGPGIPDDRKEAIFEQGELGLDSQGTGLGLYLVERLADRYEGTVRVEDNEPEGAVFVVALPVET